MVGDHIMSAFETIKAAYACYRFHGDKAVMFQQYTDTAQWTRLMT